MAASSGAPASGAPTSERNSNTAHQRLGAAAGREEAPLLHRGDGGGLEVFGGGLGGLGLRHPPVDADGDEQLDGGLAAGGERGGGVLGLGGHQHLRRSH